ncbi:QWRF motif-containing protein 7 [Dendrobium catenatum]|uniref:QWRF motif-containing protein 7 n=1 Tax=Dendrobium catenatum TaxID=906689 RepID=A0A2I0WWY0_9ASPA|nr:QWRF motif-containing protein 7 [Dendrobium catenatum]PKU80151.1 hypothetical protein MA16_Dca021326 [Dendrobium catenatum]
MESPRPPSPRFTRSRSGTPRLCHVNTPLSPNLGNRPRSRSSSATKTRPAGCNAGETGDSIRRLCKENRVEAVGPNVKKVVVSVTPSAWALSPGRYPATEGGSGGGGVGGRKRGVLSFFRRKKDAAAGREEVEHRLRVMAVRLLQWRFVNARSEAAMAASTAENKIFFAWLKLTELRNIVAAKRILIQRRKHKLKVIKVLNPQLNLLNRWELLARRHLEAVASLIKVLESACVSIPLVEGAKANLVMVHNFIFSSMDIMLAIEAAIRTFYSKTELLKSSLCELVKIIPEEVQGLDELRNTNNLITSLEMHETSLRANLIQAKKRETASPPIYEIKTGLSWKHFHPHYLIM